MSVEIAQVGQQVRKIGRTGKPFKSGLKVGTVAALCCSLYTKQRKLAYVMEEDGSIVNVDRCCIV